MVVPQIGQSEGRSQGYPDLEEPALGALLEDFLPVGLGLPDRSFFCSFLVFFIVTLGTFNSSSTFLTLLFGLPLVFAIFDQRPVLYPSMAEETQPENT